MRNSDARFLLLLKRRPFPTWCNRALRHSAKLDVNGDGIISASEFVEEYAKEKVTFGHATCLEGLKVMACFSRQGMGKWVPRRQGDDIMEPFGE